MMRVEIAKGRAFISLKDALKLAGAIPTGGFAKAFLQECEVTVNGARETRRGRKLYPGDAVAWEGRTLTVVGADER